MSKEFTSSHGRHSHQICKSRRTWCCSRRTKFRLLSFLNNPTSRHWAVAWFILVATLLLAHHNFFPGLKTSENQSARKERSLIIQHRQEMGPKRSTSTDWNAPVMWLSHRFAVRRGPSQTYHKTKNHSTIKVVHHQVARKEITPQNAQQLKSLEELLIAAYVGNSNDTMDPTERILMGLTTDREAAGMEDPLAISWIRRKLDYGLFTPGANWRVHGLDFSLLQEFRAFEKNVSFFPETALAPLGDYGKQIQVKIYDKYYQKDGFANKTFIQVGAKSRKACWECQIMRNPLTNWTGLVPEMDAAGIENYMYARPAAFCVAPARKPGIYLRKRISYQSKWPLSVTPGNNSKNGTQKMPAENKTSVTLVKIAYHDTLLPLLDIHATLSATARKNYTHISMKPVLCYPLWTIMQASDITDVNYMTIGTTGYAGKILETLPIDEIHPEVIHLTDLGDRDRSTQLFLEKKGFKLDTQLSTVSNKDFHYGDFIFHRQRHVFSS